MGTAPNGWQTPKTDWQAADAPGPSDFNRIEGNSSAMELGQRTIDPTQTPIGHVGTLRQFLDWIANRIKAILGTTNWYDAPPITLQATKSHTEANAAHGATSQAVAGKIMMRDAYGRAKVAAPSASDDVARKDTVTNHANRTDNPHSVTATQVGAVVENHKHTGISGQGPLLGVASQTWIGIGNTVLYERLEEKMLPVSSTRDGQRYYVVKPGKYRITGEFRATTSGENSSLACEVRIPASSMYGVVDFFVKTLSTNITTFTAFTIDMDIDMPSHSVISLYCASKNATYIRNLRIRGDAVAGNDFGVMLIYDCQ
jgi:hypothetical protein